jgi:opacity protein-like surface antigen
MKRMIAGAGVVAMGLGAFTGGAVHAGAVGAPAAEPTVAAPAPAPVAAPMRAGHAWTGLYGGARLGWGESGSGASGSGGIGGLHLGYLQDFGGFAAGIEGSYDAARIGTGLGGRLNEVGRLGVRAGVTTPDLFLYATGGAANARIRGLGSETGWFGGLGAEIAVTEQMRVGGEVLHHRFRNFSGSGANVNANTVQARVSFRF